MTQTTKVQVREWTDDNGEKRKQYSTTIPKQLAEAMQLEDAEVEWNVETGSKLGVERVD